MENGGSPVPAPAAPEKDGRGTNGAIRLWLMAA
jgi:hypothetical protein